MLTFVYKIKENFLKIAVENKPFISLVALWINKTLLFVFMGPKTTSRQLQLSVSALGLGLCYSAPTEGQRISTTPDSITVLHTGLNHNKQN